MALRKSFTGQDVLNVIFQDEESDFEQESSEESGSDYEAESSEGNRSEDESSTGNGYENSNDHEMSSNVPEEEENASTNNQGIDLNWQNYDDFDPFESRCLPDYNRCQGILVDTANFKPLDFFSLFYPDEVFELICNETNHKPTLEDYLNTFWLTFTNFKKVMPRNRYELIQTFIHFNDSSNQIERGQEGYDPLFKVQKLIDICCRLYEKIYSPKKCLSIDESIKFKGRIFFRQYPPAKPTKWGIKDFVSSESESGYCLKSQIYTGKSSFQRNPGQPLGDQ
ncbi:PiggyBac transposable element-derived protein 4 [Exaiptasia diaphana]|nr:PiggyBac transposable element-derived protein 4 [Exaiptasia diaphana]